MCDQVRINHPSLQYNLDLCPKFLAKSVPSFGAYFSTRHWSWSQTRSTRTAAVCQHVHPSCHEINTTILTPATLDFNNNKSPHLHYLLNPIWDQLPVLYYIRSESFSQTPPPKDAPKHKTETRPLLKCACLLLHHFQDPRNNSRSGSAWNNAERVANWANMNTMFCEIFWNQRRMSSSTSIWYPLTVGVNGMTHSHVHAPSMKLVRAFVVQRRKPSVNCTMSTSLASMISPFPAVNSISRTRMAMTVWKLIAMMISLQW